MQRLIYWTCRVGVFAAVIWAATAGIATAQSCLPLDACLLSPSRADAGRPIIPNGCSVPLEAGPLGQFWGGVFVEACNQHDIDWGTFKPDINSWLLESNLAFLTRMLGTCLARLDLPAGTCAETANLFFLAVSQTSIARDIFLQAQYQSSSCACRQPPTAPSNLTAQVSSGPSGGQVSLQWTASTDATSYLLDVLQPALGSINTNSPLPSFTATGVPNGAYRVQVRGVNPVGTSAPSNAVDVIVGSSTPCAVPAAPSGVTGSLANGIASVNWPAVLGAASYIVRAGSTPFGSDLFNGNVGAATSVSASGLPAGFRAYVRVLAVSACGTSVPSADILVGS
jgi:hypothetical protein